MQTTKPISLVGSQLDAFGYVKALFHNDNERYRVLVPFIKQDFERGGRMAGHNSAGQPIVTVPNIRRHITGGASDGGSETTPYRKGRR
jgi:hypothetical protein